MCAMAAAISAAVILDRVVLGLASLRRRGEIDTRALVDDMLNQMFECYRCIVYGDLD